jgi:nucleoid DNA-binding protein
MAVTRKKTASKKSVAKKTVARKAVAKKTAAKKTTARKTAVKKPAIKKGAVNETFSKTQLMSTIADDVGITKKQVGEVFESLTEVIERHVKKRGVGVFMLPGMLKIKTIRKPAVKARKGINPFTKEEMMFKAKPARTVVKVLPLKKLKEMVNV